LGGSWVGASAAQIARAVQRGDTTSTAVIADHVDHARVAERVLTVISLLRDAAALAEAEQVDEQPDLAHLALAGVPVVVEEATTERDVVHRLRGAGAVVLAFAGSGPAPNPWRTDRTSGGGSAAAVAAGVAPIASALYPLLSAACCGVVGLQPGQDPMATPDGQPGILATTVEDAVLGSAILVGRDPHAWPDPPTAPGRLRIAVATGSVVLAPPPDPETRESLAAVARLLVAAGHDAVRVRGPRLTRLTVATLASWRPGRDRPHGATMRRGERVDWRDRCLQWLADNRFDLILTPAMPGPPRSSPATGYAEPWRLAGLPAIVVPVGVRRDRLPAAIQLVGSPDSHEGMLAVAAQLEAAVQWLPHAPTWPRV
jgi:amidase